MEKSKRVAIIFLGSISIIIAGVMSAIYLFDYGKTDPFNFIFNNFISITSFVLSFIALIIAVITYISIDAVNSATSMEGNVLENETYSVEYSTMVRSLSMPTRELLTQALSKELKTRKRFSNCMAFSGHLQRSINNLVWLSFIDCSDEKLQEALYIFIKRTVVKAKHYESINSGLELLLDENIKTIISVAKLYIGPSLLKGTGDKKSIKDDFFYTAYLKKKNYDCQIQDVRGKMAKNPITQVIYFYSMGKRLLSEVADLPMGIYVDNDDYVCLYKTGISKRSIEDSRILHEKAIQCLQVARSVASNTLWLALTETALLQAQIIGAMIDKNDSCLRDVYKQLSVAVQAWKTTSCLFLAAKAPKDSYLMQMIGRQEDVLSMLVREFEKQVAVR